MDARNPLLFYCEDLVKYVKEIDEQKVNLLIINKSDFLSERQRLAWFRYFKGKNVNIAFWSAAISIQEEEEASKKINKEKIGDSETISNDEESVGQETENKDEDESEDETKSSATTNKFNLLIDEKGGKSSDENDDEICYYKTNNSNYIPILEKVVNRKKNEILLESGVDSVKFEKLELIDSNNENTKFYSLDKEITNEEVEGCKILNRIEMIKLFKKIQVVFGNTKPTATIGFVGYPNVGKSSTLNALLKNKKVSVSETPGKTKHYQTFLLEDGLIICDCPGLVFPSFVSTRSELIINGILPIDQMRDYNEPINLVIRDIPKNVIEMIYGIEIKISNELEKTNRFPLPEEVCSAYSSIFLCK